MKHIFGPVNSRRLGISQGIDLLPPKICNLDCIYCEVGPTTDFTCERREYVPTSEIIAELNELFTDQDAVAAVDVFTITASGEPTLHTGIGEVIRFIKTKTDKPVAVLTNGTLLHLAEVRDALMAADIVIPSLDAALPQSYRKVNRPARCASLDLLLQGLALFRKQYPGQFWLEILLVKGINDSPADITALARAASEIQPDRIQLNTVARPPLEGFARPLSQEELRSIAKQFDRPVEIIVDFEKRKREGFRPIIESEILHLLQRRPCTASDICEALNLDEGRIVPFLDELVMAGRICRTTHDNKEYYQITTG